MKMPFGTSCKLAKMQSFLHLRILFVGLWLSFCIKLNAEENDSTLILHEVEILAPVHPGMATIDHLGRITIKKRDLIQGMRIGGLTDAIKTLSYLPGYTSVSDYSAGVSANGAGYNQISYNYANAPVFFPYHFGGIFSTFNTGHIADIKSNKAFTTSSLADRVGGSVEVTPFRESVNDFSATAEVGLLASSVTLKTPYGLNVSGRISYIDQIFPWLINTDESTIKYNLSDFNLSYNNDIANDYTLTVDVLGSFDKLSYRDTNYGMTLGLRWCNLLATTALQYKDKITTQLYFSHFGSTLTFFMPNLSIDAPSYISQEGAVIKWNMTKWMNIGWRTELTKMKPQVPTLSRTLRDEEESKANIENSIYNKLFLCFTRRIIPTVDFSATAGLGLYKDYMIPSANLSVIKNIGTHTLTFAADYSTQPLFQIGMSDIGMASNFWVGANNIIKPTHGVGTNLVLNSYWCGGLISTNLEGYYKRIIDEPRYYGDMLSLQNSGYDPFDFISSYSGYNAGGSVLLRCNTRPVSGWVGADAGLSKRKYEDGEYHSSAYEPLLSLNAQVVWQISSSVNVSAVFSLHSGRPYTGVKSIYLFGGNIITEYGEINAQRMPTYHRLDLSCNYILPRIKIGKFYASHFINFSVINAYGKKNPEIQYYKYNFDTNEIYLKRTGSIYRFLPSVNYTIEF